MELYSKSGTVSCEQGLCAALFFYSGLLFFFLDNCTRLSVKAAHERSASPSHNSGTAVSPVDGILVTVTITVFSKPSYSLERATEARIYQVPAAEGSFVLKTPSSVLE